MKKLFVTACVAVMFVLAVTVVQAQTCTTPEATIISPTPGSVLPSSGTVTFSWCNASADYFVIVETVPGAHDIFFAFTGGAGGGVGQNFLTFPVVSSLPNALCQPAPPIGCIPALGENIYFTLETVKAKVLLGTHQYTFTAASPAGVAATNTTVSPASASFSTADQTVTLTATVTSTSTVNQGTVTFQVMNGTTQVGAAVTSSLTTGSAIATYLLPGGTAAGSYTIKASYSGGTNFDPSTGNGTLTVTASVGPAATTTTVTNQSATFNSADQNVTLTATIGSTSAVNEGTVTFQVADGASNPVGTSVISPTVSNGSASVVYVLPGNTAANPYTIHANYSGGTNFAASSGSGTLTVNASPPPAPNTTATTASNNSVTFSTAIQHVTLTASVSGLDALGNPVTVNEGTVTFQVKDGATNVGTAVPSATLTNGNTSVSYALPAGTAAKNTYTIQTTYSGGTNFAASNGSGTLTINKAQSTTTITSTPQSTMTQGQTYTPIVQTTGDGTLTIGASGACSVANGVVTATATTGTCTVTATESDGPNFVGSSATDQTITVIPDFSVPASLQPITVKAGQQGTTTLTITGQTGFNGTVTFACSGLPAKSGCTFSPPAAGVVTITVSTAAPQTAMLKAPGLNLWTTGGGIALAGVFLGGIAGKRRRWSLLLGLLVIAFLLTGVGCGGGTSHTTIPGTPTGAFTVTVTGTSGPLTHSTTFTLNVQ